MTVSCRKCRCTINVSIHGENFVRMKVVLPNGNIFTKRFHTNCFTKMFIYSQEKKHSACMCGQRELTIISDTPRIDVGYYEKNSYEIIRRVYHIKCFMKYWMGDDLDGFM